MRTYSEYKRNGSSRGMSKWTRKKQSGPARLVMPETRRYIEMLQNTDGSFLKSDAKTEAFSLDALRILGCDNEKIYERAKEYLLTLENRDWGFSSKPGGESSIDGTYHAVSALKKLGVTPDAAADYVLLLHRGNGSFVRDAGTPINVPTNGKVKYTCLAVSALKLLGCDEKDVFVRAKRFSLRMRHIDNGGFGSSDGIFSDATLENTYHAVKALAELGSRGAMMPGGNKTADYITGLQNADGGFSPYKAGDVGVTSDRISTNQVWRQRKPADYTHSHVPRAVRSDVQSTFYAISSLDSLGVLDREVCEKAKKYVMSLMNEDGGFCHSRSEPGPLGEPPGTGTLLSTAYAVLCLEIAGRGAKT